ncbi:hypothetical protein BO70DRAFT_363510 [Aspergillus heteromorphus CBS 117.55]|uniref:Late endosomal/lysosomal adaptor and MAPK and MTOR activator-domain-containing protein n=1 Tax=Aspergillus heteromorphus CBS 117.55 TaxID=1448321 RepID=A0A317VVF9_9EURO|nr:uncharacterized protein BO70DRAFT_363510 [Aspergillus heteromorphus CBS 117.55]PWY76952.1 hypothetical protein BO70DRAFT_363510 [Aspergillus heteromorphus CBS 117.55]
MGICSSCLGRGRRDNHDPTQSESSRLLEDDIYQPGYGYGALNQTAQGSLPDPGYLKREREALEAICQRTSDSVIDIWSLQPQPHLQPHATLPSAVPPSASDSDVPVQVTTTASTPPPRHQHRNQHSPAAKAGGTVPKHWGEVVINTRKNRSRPGSSEEQNVAAKRDVFGVLKVT